MRPRLAVSRSAVELIKAFEGFRPRAAQLDDGRWTIGYGHTLTAREGAEISEKDAEALLLYDLIQSSHAVNEHVYSPLNQNEFDALVSFVFNIGVRAFRGSPTLRRLNEGRRLEAALAMELWRKADLDGERIVIDALVRRRAAEKALFLKPPEGWTPAPTPLLPPRLDYDAVGLVPLNSPVTTRSDMIGDRAFVERAALTGPDSLEPTSVTQAAQAAIERLEAILAEPVSGDERAPAAPSGEPIRILPPPQLEAPARSAAGEARGTAEADASADAPTMFSRPRDATPAKAQPVGEALGPMLLALLGLLGLGLITLAGVWGVRPPGFAIHGVSSGVAALSVGAAGVVLAALSGYFLLERLGRPRSDAG